MNRYNFSYCDCCGISEYESDIGDWVRYSDVEKLIKICDVIASHYPDIEKSSYTASLVPYVLLRKHLKYIKGK